jgi:hypothetical protein
MPPAPKTPLNPRRGALGLLKKTNPKATTGSVLRRAIVLATAGAALFGVLIYFRSEHNPNWPGKVAFRAALRGLCGSSFEWQIYDNSLLQPARQHTDHPVPDFDMSRQTL